MAPLTTRSRRPLEIASSVIAPLSTVALPDDASCDQAKLIADVPPPVPLTAKQLAMLAVAWITTEEERGR